MKNMESTDEENESRVVIYAQTSVSAVTASTGGHGGVNETPLRVASGHSLSSVVASHGGCITDASNKHLARMDAVVDSDSDLDSVKTITSKEEKELLGSPFASQDTARPKRDRSKRSKEGLKALAEYKAAIRINHRLGSLPNLSNEEKDRVSWAKVGLEKGRNHFGDNKKYVAKNPVFRNCIEEAVIKSLQEKRQRSVDESPSATNPRQPKKRKQHDDDERPSTSKAATMSLPKVAKVNEVARRHLCVALLDMSNPYGQMTTEQWTIVESKIFKQIVSKM